jgi:preprotein translocase subunit SecG
MGLIGILLLVVFVITAILLILLVLVQGEDGDSMGGLFAGGSSSAFGSRSGNVLTKTTYILGTIFLVSSFLLAFVNKTPNSTALETGGEPVIEAVNEGDWWEQGEVAPASLEPAQPQAE